MSRLSGRAADWLAGRERHLYGMSIARILVGLAGVHYYVSNLAHHRFMFGRDSYLAGGTSGESALPYELIFPVGLVVAVAFTIRGGRALAAAHAACFWILHARNPALFDGGDAFGRVAAIVMILGVTDTFLAPGAYPRRLRRGYPGWSATVHNSAVAILVFQMCVIYLSAGSFKAFDPLWQDGVALFRVAQLEDYRFVDWTGIASNPFVVHVLTYATIVLEVAFPFALPTRARKRVVIAMAAMHAMLAVLLGLVGFALHMFAGLAVCLTDVDWRRDLFDPDQEGIVRLTPTMHLDLDTEALPDALA